MYPRVSSYAAICGRSPVASIGQPMASAGPQSKPGGDEDDLARKQHQSDLLDEAIDESFPASDPASPYVPSPLKDQGDAIDTME
jgi:hypothetical protein